MRLTAILLGCLFVLALTGCGVAFSDPPQGNEFFKSLSISGDKRVGQQLTATVAVKQSYATAVPIRCELRRNKSLVKALGEESVPAYPGGNPKVTPIAATVSFDFTVDSPGDYVVECFTTSDEDNYILKGLTIKPA